MRKLTILFTATLLAFTLAACGKQEKAAEAPKPAKNLDEWAKNMESAGKKMEEAAKTGKAEDFTKALGGMLGAVAGGDPNAKVDPVDFRELKALLPETLAGMKRVSSEGSRNAAMGINMAEAKAEYRNEGDNAKRLEVKIMDMGSLTGLGALAFAWVNVEIDRESDSGYEKTSTVNGRKMMEKWQKSGGHGEVTLVVANRFLVEAEGQGLEMADLKKVVQSVDVAKLESMKNTGVTASK